MTIKHHPSAETLAAYCNGSLDICRSVVVSAHLETCAECREHVRMLDRIGGVLLERLEPTPLSHGALERAMALLGNARPEPLVRASHGDLPNAPRALRPYELGTWRWIGPGTHYRATNIQSPDGYRVFLLRSAAGSRLPHHTHTGVELTLVVKGAFEHEGGRFGVGDLEEADGTVEHQPIVAGGEDCICLVAMNGNLRLLGVMGRLMQPFVRL